MSQSRLRAQPPSAPTIQGAYRISTAIVGVNKGRVTVNNEADSRIPARVTVAPARPGVGMRQPVTITPTSPFVPPASPKPPVIIQKVLLKAVSKVGKQVSKMAVSIHWTGILDSPLTPKIVHKSLKFRVL